MLARSGVDLAAFEGSRVAKERSGARREAHHTVALPGVGEESLRSLCCHVAHVDAFAIGAYGRSLTVGADGDRFDLSTRVEFVDQLERVDVVDEDSVLVAIPEVIGSGDEP